jgi:glutamate-ammonia-ligase adenylyltransferase
MVDRARIVPSTARFGLTDGRAEQELRAAGWWGDEGPVASREAVLTALSRAPDPDLALRGVSRLRESDVDGWPALEHALATDPVPRGRLLAVLGSSTALGDFAIARPGEWRRLAGKRTADHTAALLTAVDGLRGEAAVRALRAGYRGLLMEVHRDHRRADRPCRRGADGGAGGGLGRGGDRRPAAGHAHGDRHGQVRRPRAELRQRRRRGVRRRG